MIIKFIYPLVGLGFGAIISLLIYIYKTNMNRTDLILEKTNETLDELKMITAIQGNESRRRLGRKLGSIGQ